MAASSLSLSRDAIITAFAEVARPHIRQWYRPDSCIVSTRIAIDVFRHFGLRAEPMEVRMFADNAAMVEKLQDCPNPTRRQVDRWHRETGAHNVAVGLSAHPEGPDEWVGHLVAIVEAFMLVDASADQASRPQYDMPLPGVIITPTTPEFLAGDKPLALKFEEGTIVVYQPMAGDRGFKSAPDWWWTDVTRHVTAQIIKAMDARLTQSPL